MKLQRIRNVLRAGGAVAAFAAALFAAGVLFNFGSGTAGAAPDCDNNAIMKCGFTSASNFIANVKTNTPGDLPAIYSAYGLEPAMYDQFVASARPGTALKNGQIVVDGQVVGTGARSIGRLSSFQGSGFFTQVINGHTYYGNTNDKAFAASSIPVMVLFNDQGVMQFAVLNLCGNPESATPVKPTFSCNELKVRTVDRSTFAFSTDASAGNGATIDHVVYNFGDGTTESRNNPAEEVTHSYANDSTFNAKVSVFVKLPGVTNLHEIVPAGNCVKQVVVKPAPVPSVTIQKDVDGVKQKQVDAGQEFVYHVKVSNNGNVDLKNAVVTDTPPAGVTLLMADVGTVDTAANTWSFTIPSLLSGDSVTFSITAKVPAFVQGSLVNKACVNAPGAPNQPICDTASVTVTPPPATPASTPPVALPNTGAGAVIGIFAGVAATGFVAYQFVMQGKQLLRSAKRQ
jgi:uncharacterized repeat protein (TIGR01451 family)